MRTEVFIQRQYDGVSSKPFYVVYKLDDCEFVNIIGNTINTTIKLIRENKKLVFRGKIDKESY